MWPGFVLPGGGCTCTMLVQALRFAPPQLDLLGRARLYSAVAGAKVHRMLYRAPYREFVKERRKTVAKRQAPHLPDAGVRGGPIAVRASGGTPRKVRRAPGGGC